MLTARYWSPWGRAALVIALFVVIAVLGRPAPETGPVVARESRRPQPPPGLAPPGPQHSGGAVFPCAPPPFVFLAWYRLHAPPTGQDTPLAVARPPFAPCAAA